MYNGPLSSAKSDLRTLRLACSKRNKFNHRLEKYTDQVNYNKFPV